MRFLGLPLRGWLRQVGGVRTLLTVATLVMGGLVYFVLSNPLMASLAFAGHLFAALRAGFSITKKYTRAFIFPLNNPSGWVL
jgi:hypothetical protein